MTAVRSRALQLRTHRVRIGDFHTRALEIDGDGPTIVLLHGFSDSADGWREVLGELARAHRRCVALDLPQHGRAERAGSGPFLPQLDQFVTGAADRYGERGVVMVGNSVGGLAVLRAAHRADRALLGVVALAPAIAAPWWLAVVAAARPLLARLLTTPLPVELRGTLTGPSLISAGFSRAVAPSGLTKAARAQYASHWGPGDLRRLLLLGGQTLDEIRGPDVLADKPFRVPATLVWGSRDRICPPVGAAAIRRAHPEVATVILKGSGHCPQYERPADVARIIVDAPTSKRSTDGSPAAEVTEES